ncbi:MAG TPA: magnesium transporter [Candidatus Deferrimicrobium sp.]|nr:magnesium transporter [Candidatus Deferrimicrobium sp.]
MLSALGSIGAGFLLGTQTETISNLPGLLVLFPPLMAMRGTISGAFSARLSTALHLGTIKPSIRNNTSTFKKNFIFVIILVAIIPIWVGVFAFLVSSLFNVGGESGHLSLLGFILIAEFSGILSGFLQATITILVSILTYRRGLDPDIVVSPIIFATGDFIGVLTIVFVSQLVILSGIL